jgi:hypothetical protein
MEWTMSSMLTEAIENSRKRAAWSLENARKATALASGSALSPPVGGGNGLNILGIRDDSAKAEELARHYTGWVYSSVRPIAQRIAGQPVRVARIPKRADVLRREMGFSRMPVALRRHYEMGHDVEVLDDHPLLRAINDPNELMVRWCLVYVTVVALNITGRAFWAMIPRNEADVKDGAPPFEIWPIPSNWASPNADPSKKRPYASWTVKPPGSTEGFYVDADNMVYFYYPDFTNPFGSFAPLDAVGTAVKTSEMMGQAQLSQFKHGMNPSWILTVGRDAQVPGITGTAPRVTLTQNQRQQIIHFIRQHYRGFHRNHEPLILDSMIESATKASHSPAEMDYYNSAALPKEQITQGFGTNPLIMGQIEGANRACHDHMTELLTLRGWLRYDKVKVGDMAGTMNPATGRFEWQEVTHLHVYPNYSGEMVRLKGQKIDALVTPDHRMWTRRGQRNGRLTPESPYSFKPASELRCHDAIPLSPLPYVADRLDVFTIPGVEDGAGIRSNGSFFNAPVPMDPFLEFLGWFISEGWTVSHKNKITGRPYYTVGIKQAVGGVEECRRIHACMEALKLRSVSVSATRARAGYESSDGYARQSANTYVLNDKRLWTWLRKHCGVGSAKKRLPAFLFRLPAEQTVRTLEALLLGDGSHRTPTEGKNYSGLHASYFSTSRRLMNQVQTLALICGRGARMRKTMSSGVHAMGVSEYSREMFLLPKHISREHYEGVVWCATVPNGLLVTRRNGKTLVSGNSSMVAEEHFCTNTVNPLISLLSETGTAWMGPKFSVNGEELVFYIEPANPADPDHELKKMLAVFDRGGVDVDFLRSRLLGLPPVAGGHVAMVNPQLIPYEVIPYDENEGDYNPYMDGPSAALAGQGAGGNQNGPQGGQGGSAQGSGSGNDNTDNGNGNSDAGK